MPSVGDFSVINSWTNISLLNYWRLFSAIGLATFFPGYFILSILSRRSKITEISFTEKLGPSFLLSLMLTTLLAFALFSVNISYTHSVLIFALVNAVILTAHVILDRGTKATLQDKSKIFSFALDKPLLLLVITFGFFLVTDFILHISLDTILVGGDMMTSSATAMSILRRNSPLFETSVIQDLLGASSACYFYLIYLAFFFLLSGAPPMNATFALMPFFQIAFIIAFYQMVSVFFKKNRRMIAALSTIFLFLFGGFVLLSATLRSTDGFWNGVLGLLGSVNSQTSTYSWATFFDNLSRANVQMCRIPIFIDLTFGLRSLLAGITSLFVLGYVFRKKNLSGSLKATLIVSAITVGYLMHQVDMVIFFAVLSPIIVLLADQKSLIHLRTCLLYSLIAFMAIALLDFSLPNRIYTLQIQFLLVIGIIVFTLFAVFIRSTQLRFIEKITTFLKSSCHTWMQSDKTKLILSIAILYFYILSFFFWFDSPIRTDDYMLVPWYFYPIKFGILGLLAVGGVVFALFNKFSRSFLHFVLYTALVFLLAKFTTGVFGLYYAFAETRFMFYVFIGVSIVAAYFLLNLTKLLSGTSMKRRLICGLLVGIIFVSGISESVVTVGYWKTSGLWQVPYDVTAGELDAINYLRLNRPVNEYVTTVADEAWISRANVILSGAALNYLEFPDQLFMEQDPETALNFLKYWRVRYIYMPNRDSDFVESSKPACKEGFVMQGLLKYLPVVFENEDVKLYEIPKSESVSGSVSLVVPASFNLLTSVSLSGINYSEYIGNDYHLFSSNSTIMLDDFTIYRIPMLLDDFVVSYIPLQQITWETIMGARLEMEQDAAKLTLQTEVEGQSFPGAFLDIGDLQLNRDPQILFFNYKTDSLPSEALYYYFEFLDSDHKRIYAGELSPSTDSFSQQYFKIPDISGAKWLWIGMNTNDKSQFPPTLQLKEIGFLKPQISMQEFFWEARNGAHLEVGQNNVNITLQSETEGENWPGSLLGIDGLQLNETLPLLFFNYTTDPLPQEALYYYFEFLDSDSKRIYASELSPSTGGFSQQYYEIPDISRAKWLWIGMHTNGKSQFPPTLQLKEIGFLKPQMIAKELSVLSMTQLNIGDYIDWVRKGGKLIVFGSERGAFANFLSIYPAESAVVNGAVAYESQMSFPQVEITKTFSNDSDVSVLASFTMDSQQVTPLAYVKSAGAGEIVYLDVSSYLNAIEDSAQSVNLLSNLISFFKLIEPEFAANLSNKNTGVYAFVNQPVFLGQVDVETDFAKFVTEREILEVDTRRRVFVPGSFEAQSIRLFNVSDTGSINEESESFSNASVKEFQFRSGAAKISASNVSVVDGYGKYALLSISNSFSMSVSKGTNLEMVIEENGKVYDINIDEGSIELNGLYSSSPLLILVRSPSIVTQGEVFLPWATIWETTSTKSDVIAVSWKSPTQVLGRMSLQVDYAGTLIHAYNVQINGSVQTERQIEWWNLDKNLVGADLVPFQSFQGKHLLPIPLLLLFYVGYVYTKKRKKSKSGVKV